MTNNRDAQIVNSTIGTDVSFDIHYDTSFASRLYQDGKQTTIIPSLVSASHEKVAVQSRTLDTFALDFFAPWRGCRAEQLSISSDSILM